MSIIIATIIFIGLAAYTAKRLGLLAIVLLSFSAQGQGYNAYALHILTDEQTEALIEVLPRGLTYRLGGEEYTNHYTPDKAFVERMKMVAERTGGKVHVVCPEEGGCAELYGLFAEVAEPVVTYGNEYWFDLEQPGRVFKDLWTYLFNRQNYYRKGAREYMEGAAKAEQELRAAGHMVEVTVNAPLPQNNNLKAFADEVKKSPYRLDLHIYGKPWERDYLLKLTAWMDYFRGHSILIGEFAPVELKTRPDLKGSDTESTYRWAILRLLAERGITEVYDFTLVANDHMMRWSNAPVYHRYLVTDENVVK